MPVLDKVTVGNRLLAFRKKSGLTQSELAEAAGISPRAYANIERGEANMRIDTALNLCYTLQITPNDLFLNDCEKEEYDAKTVADRLSACSPKDRDTALAILSAFLNHI